MKKTVQFNALTDAWLPLLQEDASIVWASPVEVLCGEKDGIDLDYPRDDFRVYARLLLSVLVQALFPAKTNDELVARIKTPLDRKTVELRIAPVLADFDLFGPTPFLQVVPPLELPKQGAATFAFPAEDLFLSRVPIDKISLPIALLSVFVEQTYAGGGGRGYGAGPGGQPGAFTLIDPGTIRAAAWANSLALETVATRYASDGERPWSNALRDSQPRQSIGLVGGLFFQPRSAWLIPVGEGVCSFTGLQGPLVQRSPLGTKSKLPKKISGVEDLWQHPCAPLAVNSTGIGVIRLGADRPAWTGLAQLLNPLSKAKTKKEHPSEGPAPVLRQWKALSGFKNVHPRLLVLDFDRDKATVKRRFFEAYPLTHQLTDNPEVLARLRALVDDAQDVERALSAALSQAHDKRKHGGFAQADARSSFWASSEGPFLAWLAEVVALQEWNDLSEAVVDGARTNMHKALRTSAQKIFDSHVELSEFDPRKQALIAGARRKLKITLYPTPPTAGRVAAPAMVTP